MKKVLYAGLVAGLCFLFAGSMLTAEQTIMPGTDGLCVIPKPVTMERTKGAFALKPTTRILVSRDAKDIGKYLRELLRPATGYALAIREVSKNSIESDSIVLTTIGANDSLGDEGYALKVSPELIIIRAPKQAGLFYGVQTLR